MKGMKNMKDNALHTNISNDFYLLANDKLYDALTSILQVKKENLLPHETIHECHTEEYGEIKLINSNNEITLTVRQNAAHPLMHTLHSSSTTKFSQLIDLCGVDYLNYNYSYNCNAKNSNINNQQRFAVVYHLLSMEYNYRIRVKSFLDDNQSPSIDSVSNIWSSAVWFEREAFDLFGIHFNNHPDMRRILTDYGFIGHPFRKDFPISGFAEVTYDKTQQKVVYQDITIEPREITPKIIREDEYGHNISKS